MRILKSFTFSIFVLLLLCAVSFGQTAAVQATPACPLHAGQTLTITASGTTEIIPVPTGITIPIYNGAGTSVGSASTPKIIICSAQIQVNQAVGAADFGLVTGTGTACATGQANLTPQWQGTASVKERVDFLYGSGAPLIAPAGKAVCLKLSAAPTGARILLTYQVVVNTP
jgi:hypothetical protein